MMNTFKLHNLGILLFTNKNKNMTEFVFVDCTVLKLTGLAL